MEIHEVGSDLIQLLLPSRTECISGWTCVYCVVLVLCAVVWVKVERILDEGGV